MSLIASRPETTGNANGREPSLRALWRREFARADPTRLGDLVVLPLGISASVGLILGLWHEAHRHFLDPAFVAWSIGVDAGVQIVILLLALALAFIARRRIWSGVLFAVGFFCFLALPELVQLLLPGVAHWLMWCIALLAAIQIARSVNRHCHSRFGPWLIAVPVLAALGALSSSRVREVALLSALPKPPHSPNVLLIIVDTLRADHLSPYGYARNTSPFVNQLAQHGVLFENAVSPSSWTLPAHASILTGLYPHQDWVETDKDHLSSRWPNLANVLRLRGYRTAAFSGNYFLFNKTHGFAHGFSHFEDYEQTIAGILQQVPLSQFIMGKLTQYTTGDQDAYFGVKNAASAEKIDHDALSWIRSGDRPFFLVLNYIDLHEPVLPPEPYLHAYTSDTMARNLSLDFQESCSWADPESSCGSNRPEFLDTYDGAMRYVDHNIQNLLYQLNQHGVLHNTIVVFTSDHGQEFGDHGIYGHGKSLYRQVIQVPLIFWNPGLVPASVRIPTPVSTTEIPATILGLIAPQDRPALPGQSLQALWRSSPPVSNWPDPISELARLHWFSRGAPNYNQPVSSIVTPQWHYIRQEGSDLLFNWKNDPEETSDLCSDQPAVCAALRAQLQAAEDAQHHAG